MLYKVAKNVETIKSYYVLLFIFIFLNCTTTFISTNNKFNIKNITFLNDICYNFQNDCLFCLPIRYILLYSKLNI